MANGMLAPSFFEDFKGDSGSISAQHISMLKTYDADFVKMPMECADNMLNYYLNSMSNEIIFSGLMSFLKPLTKSHYGS